MISGGPNLAIAALSASTQKRGSTVVHIRHDSTLLVYRLIITIIGRNYRQIGGWDRPRCSQNYDQSYISHHHGRTKEALRRSKCLKQLNNVPATTVCAQWIAKVLCRKTAKAIAAQHVQMTIRTAQAAATHNVTAAAADWRDWV